jgi:hypothetical protein
MKKYNRKLLRYLIIESIKKVTGLTTVGELIAAGLLSQDFIEKSNKKLDKVANKAAKITEVQSNYDLAKFIIANFLVNTYGISGENPDLTMLKSKKTDLGQRYAFRKKPVEKKVQEIFDMLVISYPSGFGQGTPRGYVDDVFKELESQGILTTNKSLVSNKAHTRHFMKKDPALDLKTPDIEDLPKPEDINESYYAKGRYPLLKEVMQDIMDPNMEDLNLDFNLATNKNISADTTINELVNMEIISYEEKSLLESGISLEDIEYQIVDLNSLAAIANDRSILALDPGMISKIIEMTMY